MRSSILIGVLLIVLGVAALSYNGFRYTKQKEVFHAGPIKAFEDKHETISIPPILGGIAIAGGIALLIFGRRG
ncbi:MAG TPA: DUF3185 domain-containing protein [Planctomycetota bacterium]|nr:DUF3185 domain-containing protein [Planctomycetota bacterium]